MKKEYLEPNTCECGKLKFDSANHAHKHNSKQRVYFCDISSTYHLTNKVKWDSHKPPPATAMFSIRRLQRELNQMATIQQILLRYMEQKYNRTGEYKCSSKELIEHMDKERPGTNRQQVHQELSKLKNSKVITSLDEPVPDQKGAKYFCLTKHLDEVTKPVVKNEKTKVGDSTMATGELKKTEAAKPTVVAANPFDKVNSTLGDILVKVNGLSTGYSKVIEQLVELRSIASSHVTVDGDKLADVINSRLGDLQQDDSFIYRVREEMHDMHKSLTHLFNNVTAPANFDTLTDDEKYRQGIRDGIKLAVEMGLILPDA